MSLLAPPSWHLRRPISQSQLGFSDLRYAEFAANYTLKNSVAKSPWATESQPVARKQPLVLEQCCYVDIPCTGIPNTTAVLLSNTSGCFGDGIYPAFDFSISETLAEELGGGQNWTSGFLAFVDIQDHVPYPISAAAVSSSGTIPNQDYGVTICIFDAEWADASEAYVEGDDIISVTRPGELTRPLLPDPKVVTPSVYDVVRFESSWLNSLDASPAELTLDFLTGVGPDTADVSTFQIIGAKLETSLVLSPLLALVMSAAQCSFGVCTGDLSGVGISYKFTRDLGNGGTSPP